MSVFLQDLRYSLRLFRQSPGFALVAVLALAFGIGVNSAIFTLLNAIALRPLPVYKAGEVVTVYQVMQGLRSRNVHGSRAYLLLPRVRGLPRSEPRLHRSCGACLHAPGARRSRIAAALRLRGLLQLFLAAGATLHMGRGFLPSECGAQGSAPVVVLSYALWKGHFAADPQILGKSIVLNRGSYTVVGVAPEGFSGASLDRRGRLGAFLRARAVEPGQEELPGRCQHELARSGRPLEARRLPRRRPRRPGGHRRRCGSPEPGPQDHASGGHRNLHEQSGRARSRAGRRRGDPGRGQPGAGDRLRQSREPPAGARRGPPKRDCRPPGGGRLALAAAPPVAHREPAALRRGRGSRPAGRMGDPAYDGSRADGAAPRRGPFHRPESESRYTNRALLPGAGFRHRHRLRPDSRPAGFESRPQFGAQGFRRHDGRTFRGMAAQFAGHRAGRRLPGAAGRRRTAGARPTIRPGHRSRVSRRGAS